MKCRYQLMILEDVFGDGNYIPFENGYLEHNLEIVDSLEEIMMMIVDDLTSWGYLIPKNFKLKLEKSGVPMLVAYSPDRALRYQVHVVLPDFTK